jgi:hypothetical protein
MKASSMLLSSFDSGCSGGNPRSGDPGSNDGDARRLAPLEGIILELMSTGCGAMPRETSDLGLLGRTMPTCGAILPVGGILFGVVTR